MEVNTVAQKYIDDIKETVKKVAPLVVVRCITYNHKPYIKDTLEGFVMQKTNFPFIVVVHDDASTDGTPDIIKEYVKSYPDIIKPIYEEENQHSKKNGSVTRIMNAACEVTGARYIAMCEGDDYWIDPLKLQKQVDFLESHSDYSLCFHGVDVLVEGNLKLEENIYRKLENRTYSPNEILEQWTVPTASAVFRREIIQSLPKNPKFQFGDNVCWLACASKGKLYGFKDHMAIYRRQSSGWIARQGSYRSFEKFARHYEGIMESFPDLDIPVAKTIVSQDYAALTYYDLVSFRFRSMWKHIKAGWNNTKLDYCRWLVKAPILKVKRILNRMGKK